MKFSKIILAIVTILAGIGLYLLATTKERTPWWMKQDTHPGDTHQPTKESKPVTSSLLLIPPKTPNTLDSTQDRTL